MASLSSGRHPAPGRARDSRRLSGIIAARRIVAEQRERARHGARRTSTWRSSSSSAGTGSQLNRLRAQQQLSTDEALVESARLAQYRAQEALGVLVVADGPVDAADEPQLEAAAGRGAAAARSRPRSDLRLFDGPGPLGRAGRAATRRRTTCRRSTPSFVPQVTYPSQFFSPQAAGGSAPGERCRSSAAARIRGERRSARRRWMPPGPPSPAP